MNSIERTFSVLEGRKADRVPVCLTNFQPACKWAGVKLKDAFLNGEALAQTQILAWQQLRHDVVHIQNGVVGLSQLLGCKIDWQEDASPWVTERPSEEIEYFLQRKEKPDFRRDGCLIGELLKAVKIINRDIGHHAVIRPEADLGPFSLAAELIGIQELMVQLVMPERWSIVEEFISYCCDIVYALCLELHDAGAAVVGIGEGTSGPEMISPQQYVQFAKPFHMKLAQLLRKAGLPFVLHVCGNATAILDEMVATGASAIELDQRSDRDSAATACLGKTAIFGNLEPQLIAEADVQTVFDESCRCIDDFGKETRLVVGPGCDLPTNTPIDNAKAIVNASIACSNN